jgi:2-C-methyl-D-erythritol 4-phosphate cytidylyltransferase
MDTNRNRGGNMVSAVIVAGGRSVRMGGKVKKQYLDLSGIPVLARTLMVFHACPGIDRIIIVIPEEDIPFCKKNILSRIQEKTPARIVAGGKERQQSVYKGLIAVEDKTSIVVIHDGVRPFITPEDISLCSEGARHFGACIMAVPVQETLKKTVPGKAYIEKTLDRKDTWLAQTPQAFSYPLILNAHETAVIEEFEGTDDASLVERIGQPVKIVSGSRFNIKITTPDDLVLGETLCKIGIPGSAQC